ncbi:hypothetical protein PG994_000118 [Apiospora phragmitis]|uniref:Uncharacterized protein n=1 Tax=Apiospora phragmitis TaxID=2905665 RepID=A0ABR1X5E6_9PEZI
MPGLTGATFAPTLTPHVAVIRRQFEHMFGIESLLDQESEKGAQDTGGGRGLVVAGSVASSAAGGGAVAIGARVGRIAAVGAAVAAGASGLGASAGGDTSDAGGVTDDGGGGGANAYGEGGEAAAATGGNGQGVRASAKASGDGRNRGLRGLDLGLGGDGGVHRVGGHASDDTIRVGLGQVCGGRVGVVVGVRRRLGGGLAVGASEANEDSLRGKWKSEGKVVP